MCLCLQVHRPTRPWLTQKQAFHRNRRVWDNKLIDCLRLNRWIKAETGAALLTVISCSWCSPDVMESNTDTLSPTLLCASLQLSKNPSTVLSLITCTQTCNSYCHSLDIFPSLSNKSRLFRVFECGKIMRWMFWWHEWHSYITCQGSYIPDHQSALCPVI